MGADPKPKPSVAFATRIDVESHKRRQRLQRKTGMKTPELVRRALMSLEAQLARGDEERPAS